MSISAETKFKFFNIVERLEGILGHEDNILNLIDLIDETQFIQFRTQVIDLFDVDIDRDFKGKFGEEVELGDVCSAVRGVTFGMYPQSTAADKDITLAEREVWCVSIIKQMDYAAAIN